MTKVSTERILTVDLGPENIKQREGKMIKRITKFLALLRDVVFYFPSLMMQLIGETMLQYIEEKQDGRSEEE